MNSFVFDFQDIDKTTSEVAGGKGANLGELTRIDGIRVPDGFACLRMHLKGSWEKRRR